VSIRMDRRRGRPSIVDNVHSIKRGTANGSRLLVAHDTLIALRYCSRVVARAYMYYLYSYDGTNAAVGVRSLQGCSRRGSSIAAGQGAGPSERHRPVVRVMRLSIAGRSLGLRIQFLQADEREQEARLLRREHDRVGNCYLRGH
jgi:hypothetical protein